MNRPEDISPPDIYSTSFLERWRRFMAQASDRAIFGFLLIFISGILLICISGIFLVEWLRYQPSNMASVASANEVTATITNTLSPNGTPTMIETPQIVNNTTITLNTGIQTSLVQVASPARIKMGEQTLPVYPETITAEDLLNITPYEDVRWVQNSIVNYVFQFPNTAIYQQLLQSAQPGDRIELIGSSGDVKVYTVEEVLPAAPEPHHIRQDEPAITLILAGEKPLVVRGQFTITAENETVFPASQAGVSVGETAVIGNATLAIQKATQLHAAENLPMGYMLYQIEFELTNNGADSIINSSWFNFTLIDDVGNQYQNQEATAASPELQAGQSVQHIAAFQVPASLSNSVFNLFVSRIDGPETVNVALPHTPTTVLASHIELMEAQLSTDGTLLLLTGEVSNLGADPLRVEADDISLQSEGQTYLIFEATPPLPWNVQPGTAVPFLLRTQRPDASEAVIQIQGHAFSLQNLR